MIRGKGSVKEGKVGRKDGQMLPGEDEPLHALVTANTMENVKKAVEQVSYDCMTHGAFHRPPYSDVIFQVFVKLMAEFSLWDLSRSVIS